MTTTTQRTMTAIVHDAYGDASVLRHDRIGVPEPKAGEIRVRVRAVSLNPADKFFMTGNPRVLRLMFGLTRPRLRVRGQDFAGTVDAVGEGVTDLAVGTEVFGAFDGALAEYACGDADRVAPLPPTVTFEDAAGIPMAGLAALAAVRAAKIGQGTTLLINGAAGGIGTFAIQLAKARGAHVTAVCSTRNVELVKSLGADHVIDYRQERLLATDERFDVILDNVGNYRLRELKRLLRGKGVLQPNAGEHGPDGSVITRMVKAQWHNLFSPHRVSMFTSGPNRADLAELGEMVASGSLRVVVDNLFGFDHAGDAMRRVASRHARGKVVVTVP